MGEPEYQVVANVSAIDVGKKLCVSVAGREILLCRTADGFFAIANMCSHAEATLDSGRMRGHRILCPLHGAAFDVRDGKALSPPAIAPIATYPVRVEGDNVLVAIPPAQS